MKRFAVLSILAIAAVGCGKSGTTTADQAELATFDDYIKGQGKPNDAYVCTESVAVTDARSQDLMPALQRMLFRLRENGYQIVSVFPVTDSSGATVRIVACGQKR